MAHVHWKRFTGVVSTIKTHIINVYKQKKKEKESLFNTKKLE